LAPLDVVLEQDLNREVEAGRFGDSLFSEGHQQFLGVSFPMDRKIVDANGQALAYVYGLDDSRDARIAKSLTRDEARRIASNIAKLPDLLGKGS
jgi:hypothetical protein